MINFRYHVVSLTAVFLALAVGLVLGSTVLNGPMLDALENRVNTLGRDNSQLREQVHALEQEVDREQDFATEAAPYLLDGALTDRRVTAVVLPGGEDYVDGVTSQLTAAGATVTGTVAVTEKFTHPQHRRSELLDLAHRAVPPSVAADALPANSDGVETSAALLSRVLLEDGGVETPADSEGDGDSDGDGDADGDTDGDTAVTVPDEDRREVLSSYANLDYLAPDGVTQAAQMLVVVAGLPDPDGDAQQRNEAMLTTVAQLGQQGPVLVAASGLAGEGNVAAGVRSDPELADAVSTVDNAATPQGQIVTALGVAEQLDGRVAHYGTGEGADRLLPERSAP